MVAVVKRRRAGVPETRRGHNVHGVFWVERAGLTQSYGNLYIMDASTRRRATHNLHGLLPCAAPCLILVPQDTDLSLRNYKKRARTHPISPCRVIPRRKDKLYAQKCELRPGMPHGVPQTRAGTRPKLNPGDVLCVYSARRRLLRLLLLPHNFPEAPARGGGDGSLEAPVCAAKSAWLRGWTRCGTNGEPGSREIQ